MADIILSDLTNSTDHVEGTGVFDVLIQAVERHVNSQYEEGRLAGTDFATVYLGSMQSVLSEAVKYLMTEQQADRQADLISAQILSETKNHEVGGVIDLNKRKLQEEIDLIIAKTAAEYENIGASTQNTVRQNLLNSKQVIKVEKDTELVISQNSELLLNGPEERLLTIEKKKATTSGALDNTNKTNADVALTNAQEVKTISETLHERYAAIAKLDKELGYTVTFTLDGSVTNFVASTDGLIDKNIAWTGSRDAEQLAATTRQNSESAKKVLLLEAQTTGFKTDSKQKMLKLMMDGIAVDTTTGGLPIINGLTNVANISEVANDILTDWGETAYI